MAKQEMEHMVEGVNKITISKSQLAMLIYDECKNINFRKYNLNQLYGIMAGDKDSLYKPKITLRSLME